MTLRKSGRCLILHNVPRSGEAWHESDVGVLAEVEAVAQALERLGIPHRIAPVRSLRHLSDVLAVSEEDVAFNLVEVLEGGPLDACLVPALCDAFEVSPTGSDTMCLAVTLDKWLTKAALRAAGLPVPEGVVVGPGEKIPADRLPPGPCIVKPLRCDASEGVEADSVVDGPGSALEAAVERVHRAFVQPALVEQFISGRELNVSLIQRGQTVEVLPLAEIDFGAFGEGRPRVVGYSAKWRPESFEYQHTPRVIPAPLPEALADEVRRLARRAWHAVGCRDYARVDFRLDACGRPFILEVNANPDISPDAGFAAALSAAGIAFDEFVETMITNAKSRASVGAGPERGATDVASGTLVLRGLEESDRDEILSWLRRTRRFYPREIVVAEEVLNDALRGAGGYVSLVAEESGKAIGWLCYGATPCTLETYDIYWVAVSPDHQRRSVGGALIRRAEEQIRAARGRMICVETSGRQEYLPAQRFYAKHGYREVARVPDFYAPGDDKVIFAKYLS